jgi:putative oxidoreductase
MNMDNFLGALRPVAFQRVAHCGGLHLLYPRRRKAVQLFGGSTVSEPVSLLGLAGVLEFFGGLAIVLGVRTQYVAFLLSGEMAFAYWYRHVAGGGLWHWANGGELAAVYSLNFLAMSVVGGGDFGVDGLLKRRTAN